MLHQRDVEGFKQVIPLFIKLLPGNAFSFTDREKITDVFSHPDLKMEIFKVGTSLTQWGDRGSSKAIRTGEVQNEVLVTVIFGARLFMQNIPFVDDSGQIAGTINIVSVRQHSIANAFPDFAPIITEMFPEGAGMYMTDDQKIVARQGSSKFDLDVKIGQALDKDSVAMQAINSKGIKSQNIAKEVYGIPVLSVSYPLYDDGDKNNVIGSFGLTIPQETSH